MSGSSTDLLSLAAQFVNNTNRHIFLTGKAGTGKTTFLRNLSNHTHKNYLVVAPTGIAALNAKGVTIHSQFLLPPGTFISEENPNMDFSSGWVYSKNILARKNPLNSVRKQVLRNIDLLIIDEVSMLRADLLDAIDYRLKSVKGNFKKSFGGVQLLMIGDLFQLPPIVNDKEWSLLKNTYKSPLFFESLALKQDGFTYIELEKIFRQQDEKFIRILNNLRNNICTREDIQELNKHYQTIDEGQIDEEIITITTHNYIADNINKKALEKLPGPCRIYQAEINGDFPESMFPLPQYLELKVGAQVMFIKNDPDQKYFNGKLATIVDLDDDEITVKMAGEEENYVLKLHQWKNIKFRVNEDNQIEEEEVGSFHQYPIKPAWAITVHKSQGLTFDKAIIDVGQAFAPGQVYVALSRLRSLDGLILRTKIHDAAISSDPDVIQFSSTKDLQEPLDLNLKKQQQEYLKTILHGTFDFSEIVNQIVYTQKNIAPKIIAKQPEMLQQLVDLENKFLGEKDNSIRFRHQITKLLASENQEYLKERINKAKKYYVDFIYDCLKMLYVHMEAVKQVAKTKTYQNLLDELEQIITKKIENLEKTSTITLCVLNNIPIKKDLDFPQRHRSRKEEILSGIEKAEIPIKKKKQEKGATYLETLKLYKSGLTTSEIAKARNLAVSTIESHLVKHIGEGNIEIREFLEESELEMLKKEFKPEVTSLTEIHKAFEGRYSFGKLRMVQAWLSRN